MNTSIVRVSLWVTVGFLASTAGAAVDIETVRVGNPGNVADTVVGYPGIYFGSVDYTYNIGKYEVTAGQYTAFLNAVANTNAYSLYDAGMDTSIYPGSNGCNIKRSGSYGSYTYSVAPEYANRPVNYVSYWSACRFANWLHNGQPTGAPGPGTTETGAYTLDRWVSAGWSVQRNPGSKWAISNENEWYKAAYYDPNKPGGAGYWAYPTRSNAAPSNTLASNGTNNANYINVSYALGPPDFRTEVGAFASSPSAYGTFDQGGNVLEWNEDLFDPDDTGTGERVLRGGSFNSRNAWLSSAGRDRYYPWYGDPYKGFRVVMLPEPGTLALLALGGLGIIRRREA